MSLLESAIREHLALKRRTGAHEAELADAEALVGERRQPAPPALGTGPPRPGPRPARGRRIRALARLARRHKLRTALVAVPLLLVTPLVSYSEAMLKPSDASLGVRSIEWLRDHGMAWLVSDVENAYYSINAPAKGGAALRALPRVGVAAPRGHATGAVEPARIAPVIRPALPGEGVWRPTGSRVAGAPPVLVTTFRPDRDYPRVVAGVAWIDSSRTRTVLYPGRYQPPSASSRGPLEVPPGRRRALVATFNSGFKLQDAQGGGFVTGGQVDAPLSRGQATLVAYRDGRVDVLRWQGPARPGPDVLWARQNLPLIVDGGRANPNLSDGPQWGVTLGNAIRVWRSGVGVDRHGNLLYAAANDQTVGSLAQILIRAGAVRAMELDINSYWVSFISYGPRGPANLLPDMQRSSDRYLTTSDRDFLAVYRRPPARAGVATP